MKNKSSFWKYIKSRLPIFVIVICIITAAVASGVMGKYVADKDDEASFDVIAEPKLFLDVSEPSVTENADGTIYNNYTITNPTSSNMKSYIRFTVVVNWRSNNHGELWFTEPVEGVDYSISSGDYTKIGEHYYYNGEVSIGGFFNLQVQQLRQKDGYTMEIQVHSESIQCVPESAAADAWGFEFNGTEWVEVIN